MRRISIFAILGVVAVAALGAVLAGRSFSTSEKTLEELAESTHFHGIAAVPGEPGRFYLATHDGLYIVTSEGTARRISETRDDFMGFTPHPADPATLYASGHPAGSGNLGFIVSRDGGQTWQKLSDGIGGPVDFHQMDVSPSDPDVIYGVHRGLQKSTDGGRRWARVGPAPEGLIDLAVSARDPDVLYGATRRGLLRSTDGGKTWRFADVVRRPATMVQTIGDGRVYVFVAGAGLLRASGDARKWGLVSGGFGGDYVLHLAATAPDPRTLYVVTFSPDTRAQAVLVSRDAGKSWRVVPGAG